MRQEILLTVFMVLLLFVERWVRKTLRVFRNCQVHGKIFCFWM